MMYTLVKEKLRPELVRRITEQIAFSRLNYGVQMEVARFMLEREIERSNRQFHTTITFDKNVLELILIEGLMPDLELVLSDAVLSALWVMR